MWIVYFRDEKGREFAEYFYMRKSSMLLASDKEYGEKWDTYASICLEEKYGEWLIERRHPVDLTQGYPERHYTFSINEEENTELVAEKLAKLYNEVFLMSKSTSKVSLNCGVKKEGELLAIFSVDKIYGYMNEQKLRDYFLHDLKSSMSEH